MHSEGFAALVRRNIIVRRATLINLLAKPVKCCYAQRMGRVLTLLVGLASCVGISSAALAASEPCKDCNAAAELTIREQIKAERARDADRVAKESTARPWDSKDVGQAKRPNPTPIVR